MGLLFRVRRVAKRMSKNKSELTGFEELKLAREQLLARESCPVKRETLKEWIKEVEGLIKTHKIWQAAIKGGEIFLLQKVV
ncbi:MAG: hypothetical protein JWO91_459 [Acidobacteriaceae bacterium]|nr:hypothetical protein [Acidobacteriaceae bacterium]